MVRQQLGAKHLSDDAVEFETGGWTAPTNFPARPEKEVHIWLISVGIASEDLDPRDVLHTDEIARAERLRSAEARTRFTRSHIALRRILAEYSNREPRELRFDSGPAGKPRLINDDAAPVLSFNLTHSGDVALCAVSGTGEVGVDVEVVKPLRNVEGLATRHFSEAELGDWRALEAADQLQGFYRVWTRKEALLKAAGLGLSRPLDRVDTLAGTLDEARYWMRDLDLDNSLRAAIACTDRPEALRCWKWNDALAPTRGF